jgi:tRNA pseudouridine38-40 synthase
MANWKLTLSYDGTAFFGWQVQPGRPTVQGTLAAAIAGITGEQVLPQGSGRTDAGVHALAQVASFAIAASIPEANLQRALNHALPPAIRVLSAELAPQGFHARHGALRKTYEYRIFEGAADICSPFLARFAWNCHWRLDLAAMRAAANHLCGTHNFASFAAVDADAVTRSGTTGGPNPVKTVFASEVQRENGLLVYRIIGSGFLHHMVRNVVGTLVEVGRAALQPDSVPPILAAGDRAAAGPTAPAQGLFLVSVEYPEMPR